VLFSIGCYLGKISGEGMLKSGARFLLIGLAASMLYLALQQFHKTLIV
jgi:VIT1/CCC1 family predicted Fe2+/Mn2+ transporter